MPFYYAMGKIPHKRHTQFRKPDGGLYAEELFGEEGFSGVASLLYHQHPPTRVSKIARYGSVCRDEWQQETHRHHHLKTAEHARRWRSHRGASDADVSTATASSRSRGPTEPMSYFYRNARGTSCSSSTQGNGTLETTFGLLPYSEGDYLVIPRGTTWRLQPEGGRPALPGRRGVWRRDSVAEALSQPVRPVARTLALLRARSASADRVARSRGARRVRRAGQASTTR